MADSNHTTAPPTSPHSSHSRRGGRGQSANQGALPLQPDSPDRGAGRGSRRPRGGRGRGRGRGQAQGHEHRNIDNNVSATSVPLSSETASDQSYGRPPGGSFGVRLTEAASNIQGDLKVPAADVQPQDESAVADDAEVCFICASPIEHTSIAPCNHQTCHICALRLRALYKTRACAHCRTESPFVIFTDNAEKQYQDFTDADFVKLDENLGIKYEKDVILEDTILLLRYNCPDETCDVACLGWPDLHRHVRSKHGKTMCDLCTRNKKVFTHEHELFTFGELRRHEKFGDDNPGAVDQSGFKGHPECGFCKQRFYGDDELYNHCREKHERCHICDRRNGGRNPQYYLNYQELERHFADAHFVCLDAECQANKTNVFESEMDLKAHQLSEHPNGLSKDARRDARLVDLSGFEIRAPYQPQRRGGREPRGAGRGRDPNSEPLPMSSAQPMSRAELAYQRQMAIQSSQSLTPRTFGGQLTQPAQSTSAPRPQPSAPASQRPKEPPSLDTLSIESPAPNQALTPQDQARTLRHQAVIDRASTLLANKQQKISQFRTHVSSYRSGTVSASDLIDSFFSLFDCPSAELGKLVRELADLYEDESKRQQLLESWNNWRSINEDYPSLPGPSGTLPGASSNLTLGHGRRVLKLKNSTAQSSRSAVSRQGSWGNALGDISAPGSSASREAFPALASSRKAATSQTPSSNSTPWSHSAAAPSTSNPSIIPTTTTTASRVSNTRLQNSLPPTMSARQNESLFPSLPAAAKPNVMMAGFNTRGSVRWNDHRSGSNTPTNPWSGGGGTTPTPAQAAAAVAAAIGGGTGAGGSGAGGTGEENFKKKGKKGKGKGETLFHFG